MNSFILIKMLRRYIKFGLVGTSGIGVDMLVLFFLTDSHMLGWNLSLSKALAAEVAIVNNFAWNEFWTFSDLSMARQGWRDRMGRLGKFNLICLTGIGISIVLLNAQVRLLPVNIYIANLVAIVLVSVWNFGMNLKFGWGKTVTGEKCSNPRAICGQPTPASDCFPDETPNGAAQ